MTHCQSDVDSAKPSLMLIMCILGLVSPIKTNTRFIWFRPKLVAKVWEISATRVAEMNNRNPSCSYRRLRVNISAAVTTLYFSSGYIYNYLEIYMNVSTLQLIRVARHSPRNLGLLLRCNDIEIPGTQREIQVMRKVEFYCAWQQDEGIEIPKESRVVWHEEF